MGGKVEGATGEGCLVIGGAIERSGEKRGGRKALIGRGTETGNLGSLFSSSFLSQ